jgi:hypothetical protein
VDKPKDKRGGALPGTGGKRPGAGRKPKIIKLSEYPTDKKPESLPESLPVANNPDVPKKQNALVVDETNDAMVFLENVMNDVCADPKMRVDSAKALLAY